ncbi:hypothetical protein BDF20DRAFT_816437 [Mycotypha africana]|uniref:uncharacterized protein n=1 Tax=Mycotypha africana TaxID=64632 RepID=UPI002301497E|nr:uncharacterized protein BDF20DRAFT_816437 [Mycotypha africana]KAI8984272.1 hypothetical protein BDF20DRAFT_816437 [Mycotypha africana]
MAERQRRQTSPSRLLHLPLEVFVKTSHYLSFADLWYLGTSSRYCRVLAHQIIWHKYQIDLSKPELNIFSHMVHAALAYITRHGYKKNTNKLDYFIIQSVANRLAVEIYDKTPFNNWEPCLDFFLDKTLGILLDHVFLDPLLDVVPAHSSSPFTDLQRRASNDKINRRILMTEFFPTRMGRLLSSFLTTFYPTLTALFETESTTEIHHRLLLNHINRHLDNMAKRYHNHCQRELLLVSSSRTAHANALTAIKQHFKFIRLNYRIMIRFIGTLLQTDLLSANDVSTLIRQRIQFFYLIPHSDADVTGSIFATLSNDTKHYFWQMWLDEIDFQMETYLDLTRSILALERTLQSRNAEIIKISSMLDEIMSNLISKEFSKNLFMLFTTGSSSPSSSSQDSNTSNITNITTTVTSDATVATTTTTTTSV